VNFLFSVIFIFELAIKLIGFGWRYFRDPWNIFDIIIVTVSILGLIFSSSSDEESLGPQTTIIRSFRIVRILFFFKKNRALKSTLMTFFASLPAMANIGGLLLIIILMYSILGVSLFADVMLNGSLDENANFKNLGAAFITLIRVTTGEDWPKIMEALSREHSPQF
jgi:voltage-gated cation channel